MAVGEVVHVLHTHDGRDALRLGDLVSGDITDPEMANQTLRLEFDESPERFAERTGLEPWASPSRMLTKSSISTRGPEDFR